jgi:hypothetical protein
MRQSGVVVDLKLCGQPALAPDSRFRRLPLKAGHVGRLGQGS